MNLLERLPDESNRGYAYRTVRTNIMNLTLLPGTPISELELCNTLNLSRTPIREALILLEKEKLIEISPKKKSYVSFIHLQLANSAIFMQKAMEKEILHEACEKISSESLSRLENNLEVQKSLLPQENDHLTFYHLDNLFHSIIYDSVQKKDIWDAIENMNTHYNRLRQFDVKNISLNDIVEQHERLIEIIRNKEHDAVNSFVNNHLGGIFRRIDDVKAEFKNFICE